MREVLMVVTVAVAGLMVGVEFSVAAFVEPLFGRLPKEAAVAARSDGARLLGRVMPFWYIGTVLLGVWWAAQAWGQPQALTVAVAVVLLLVSVVTSVTLLVPINNRVARWAAEGAPADWQRQVGCWNGFHHLRVGLIVVAFALLAPAGVASRPGPPESSFRARA